MFNASQIGAECYERLANPGTKPGFRSYAHELRERGVRVEQRRG